jgi:GT2 family glycosyltransferase
MGAVVLIEWFGRLSLCRPSCNRVDMLSSHSPRVGLITIWYRAGSQIDRFSTNLRALQYPKVEPVFVIHSLPSGQVQRLRDASPSANVLYPDHNLGSATGWNLGIHVLLDKCVPYIGIWNTDVQLDPNCLGELVRVMEADARIGATQPLLLYADAPDTVEMFGGSFESHNGIASHDYAGHTGLNDLPAVRDVQYLDGGTMLIRSSVLRRIGGFDERLFLYNEDSDLSIRIQHAGLRTVAVRDARAWHYHRQIHGSLPPPYAVFYLTRNRFYMVLKHGGRSAWLRLLLRTLRQLPRVTLFYIRRGNPVLAAAHASGAIHGMFGLMGKRGWVD